VSEELYADFKHWDLGVAEVLLLDI